MDYTSISSRVHPINRKRSNKTKKMSPTRILRLRNQTFYLGLFLFMFVLSSLPPSSLSSSCCSLACCSSSCCQPQKTDLSQDWEYHPLYNNNEGYCRIQSILPQNILGYVLIQKGQIIAEGYNKYVKIEGGSGSRSRSGSRDHHVANGEDDDSIVTDNEDNSIGEEEDDDNFVEYNGNNMNNYGRSYSRSGSSDETEDSSTYPFRLNKVYGTTRSWCSLLIGQMIEDNQVQLNSTLFEIFDNPLQWVNIEQAEEKQTITLEEILTMTAGLKIPQIIYFGFDNQRNLRETLNAVEYDPALRGNFNYLEGWNIISFIIRRRSGKTPLQYANQTGGVFDSFNMRNRRDYSWDQKRFDRNVEGIEDCGKGLITNPRNQAKLGQLYLQDGYVNNQKQIINEEWLRVSTTRELPNKGLTSSPIFLGYGYDWWTDIGSDFINALLFPNVMGAYTAKGLRGNFITVFPKKDMVMAIVGNMGKDSDGDKFLLNSMRNFKYLHKELAGHFNRNCTLFFEASGGIGQGNRGTLADTIYFGLLYAGNRVSNIINLGNFVEIQLNNLFNLIIGLLPFQLPF